jgi:KUP system potassium uptake protein
MELGTMSVNATTKTDPHAGSAGHGPLAALSLAALGVVYGDIGTSPIYAMRESLHGAHGVAPTAANVLGLLSLIVWALIIVISIKYLTFVMRADNCGEGGMIALTALVTPVSAKARRRRRALVLVGLFGASLLYGDSMITPAISVLSAVEGLSVVTPVFSPYVIPLTVAILIAIFAVQSRGTARIGSIFGPVMLVWFATLGVLGATQLLQHPGVLAAVNPAHGVRFFAENGWQGFVVLGSVFLVVTGGEALYADMGHFGVTPIRLSWFGFVLPALLLCYFGQGALVLGDPSAAEHPFYRLVPEWGLIPLVILTTLATVIASQAVISGAFSLTRQAVQLGYLPRVEVKHTSEDAGGANLHPGAQLAPDDRLHRAGARLPLVEQSGRGVRRGGDDRHGVHLHPLRGRGAHALEVEPARGGGASGGLPGRGPRLLGREPAQDPERRLVPARDRRRGLHGDDDVEHGPRHPRRAPRGARGLLGATRA